MIDRRIIDSIASVFVVVLYVNAFFHLHMYTCKYNIIHRSKLILTSGALLCKLGARNQLIFVHMPFYYCRFLNK